MTGVKAPTKVTGMGSGDGNERKERVPDKESRQEAGMSGLKHLLSRPRAVLATLLEHCTFDTHAEDYHCQPVLNQNLKLTCFFCT